jgi:hypothetical protein
MAQVEIVPVEYILGLPWFMWAMVGLGIGIMIVLGIFIVYWFMMGPCRAYFRAQWNNEDLMLLATKQGKLQFKRSKYVTGIFNSIDLPLSWIQRSEEAYRLGKCMTKIVTDASGICTEPTIYQAIKVAVFEWNERELNREEYLKSQGQDYEPDLICEYYDLYKLIKEGKIDDPVVIPAVFEVPINQVKNYLAHIGPGDLEGHISVRVAEELEKEDPGALPVWAKVFLFALLGIVGVGAVLMYFMQSA